MAKSKSRHTAVTVTVICLLIIVGIVGYNSVMRYLYPLEYKEYVEKYSEEYSIDKNLIFAVIKCESNFKQDAVSHAEARGLMQMTEDTFEWVQKLCNNSVDKILDIHDPETNIKYGVFLLSYYENKFSGNIEQMLAAYNAGMGNATSWDDDGNFSLEDIKYAETKKYVTKVMKTKTIYDKLYKDTEAVK